MTEPPAKRTRATEAEDGAVEPAPGTTPPAKRAKTAQAATPVSKRARALNHQNHENHQNHQKEGAIRKGYHPNFIGGPVLEALWRYTLTRTPYHVHLRKQPVKSRPKINYGVPNTKGEYGLYRWGQEKRDWNRIEQMPPEILAVVDEIERVFGVRPNHVIATYYHNGKEQWIPVHQDKAISIESKGPVESQTTIFNLSLGAVRPFIITTLGCLGETERRKLEIVDEFPMNSSDLFALEGSINSRYGHCVPKDSSIHDLRVSYVFRCVTKDLVHPTERYYLEMDKTGRHIPLPELEEEPAPSGL